MTVGALLFKERAAASQIGTRSSSNLAYASNAALDVSRDYRSNGLNQYTEAGAAAFGYDANGNLRSVAAGPQGTTAYVHDAGNRPGKTGTATKYARVAPAEALEDTGFRRADDMALHFTLVGESELSVHFDIDGLAELLKGVEAAIRAAQEHARSGAPDGVPLNVAGDLPNALGKVTVTLIETSPPLIH